MRAEQGEQVDGLLAVRAIDRAELERYVLAAEGVIADLQARLGAARRRLAAAESRTAHVRDLAASVGLAVLDVQRRIRVEEAEACRTAAAVLDAAAVAARCLAQPSAVTAVDVVEEPAPQARVLDFTTRIDDRQVAGWSDGRIAVS